MSDEIADRAHPAPEELSAYLANELSAEENDRIQEHVASCSLCAESLLDLQRFLEFTPDQSREGIADLETAAEWRKLRRRIEQEEERRRFFASARGGYTVAAALLAVSVGLLVWNLNLVRERRQPRPLATIRTLEAKENFRGRTQPFGEEAVLLPAQITLNLPVEEPEPLYRVELYAPARRHPQQFLQLPPQGSELRFSLPEQALSPGRYVLRVQGVRQGRPSGMVWTYEMTIGASTP